MSSSTTSPCGDRVVREGDTLTIHAALPIVDLEPSKYRAPILVYDEERFVLVSMRGSARRPVYVLQREQPNLYAPEGKVISYDGERHLDVRRARARTALAWVLWIPSIPLLPLLGLLPESWKEKLVHLGIDPGRATRASLMIEWIIVAVCMIFYPITGGFFTPLGAVVGAIALVTATDIAYRVTSDADNRNPGMYGIFSAVFRWVREMRRDVPLVDDAERERLLKTTPELERERERG